VREWASGRGVAFGRDEAGNVVLHLGRARRGRGRWWLTAHMDHPGFAVLGRRGRTVRAEFRGGVGEEYGPGERVRLFAPGGEAVGTVAGKRACGPASWWRCRIELEQPAAAPPGTVGMWDLPAFAVRGQRLRARACDDLAGAAAVVCAMDELAERGGAEVSALLTRAEEAGFVGALAACKAGTIPREAHVLSIEASKAQPAAPLGGGAVIRVGDRTSLFDPELTAHLAATAGALAAGDKEFRFVRALMPGGTCESTVFCAYGYRSAAACLPLGNYHNQGPRGRIAAEYIDLRDFGALVKLLTAVGANDNPPAETTRTLRERLGEMLAEREKLLRE
jgi:endoglucanase